MRYPQRRLPHWETIGQPLFVTFRLHASLPRNRPFPPPNVSSGQAFVTMDRLLDRMMSGPAFLQRPAIAKIVIAALRDGHSHFRRYDLHCYVVMPNHVHMLATPYIAARYWLGPLKGFTAHEANRILCRTGPFWQDESYDHLVRDGEAFLRIRAYIENNPVKAGLAPAPERYPWSSATLNQT